MEAEENYGKGRLIDARLAAGAFLFVSVCLFWIYCLPPGLAAYRDAGEMACDVYTLGVAHQPGYPLYILTAKLASLVLPGNFAYKLNLFSAACGLGAVLGLYSALSGLFGTLPALAAAILFSLNFTMQTVSGVSEMYSLNLFLAVLLLRASLSLERAWERSTFWAGAYLLGLAMTNRMDIVLAAPAFLIAAWPGLRASSGAAWTAAGGALFWLSGFSLYFYLYVRSGSDPLFDWSHPADFATFIAVITRKSYGSTLDLISRNYAPGELFLPNLKYYALHLVRNFNLALFAAAAGMASEFAGRRRRFFVLTAFFLTSGPLFLYMANMPPNPHALAIVEPYYLLPDLAVAFWAAAGLASLARRFKAPSPAAAAAAALFAALAAGENLPAVCRRLDFSAEDWGRDAMSGVPTSSVLVSKKDVQLFTLWYLQTVRGERTDIKLVAQGLSGAAWYRRSTALWRPGLMLSDLNSGGAAAWREFIGSNTGGVYASLDAEIPEGLPAFPRGLVSAFEAGRAADQWPSYNFRWLRGGGYPDFFAKDLGSSYAAAAVAQAAWRNNNGGMTAEEAERLELAAAMDPDLPDPPLYLGFYHSAAGNWAEAAARFRRAADLNTSLLALAEEYRTLPELKRGVSRAGAYAWLNYGVALEKTGDPRGAESAYLRALAADPGMADAHYNMAILYWHKDRTRVREELSAALAADPGHRQAAYYLGRLTSGSKE